MEKSKVEEIAAKVQKDRKLRLALLLSPVAALASANVEAKDSEAQKLIQHTSSVVAEGKILDARIGDDKRGSLMVIGGGLVPPKNMPAGQKSHGGR